MARERQKAEARTQSARVWSAEAVATWTVHRLLESGYKLATGREPPTARDRNVPLRRVLTWAAVSAAVVAVADVTADRFVLRTDSRVSASPGPVPVRSD